VGHVPCARARHFRKGKERPPSALRPHPQEPQLFLIHSLSDLQFFDNHKCIRRATLLHQVSTMTPPQDKLEANVPLMTDDEQVRQLHLGTAEVVH